MSRVIKLEINETLEELQELLRKQKTASGKERVQALYLLKTRSRRNSTTPSCCAR